MISYFKNLAQKFYHFWINFTNLKNKTKILPVDFSNHWGKIIWNQKKYLLTAFTSETCTQIFYTLIPMLIGLAVKQGQFVYFLLLCIGWLIAIFGEYITAYNATMLEVQCINSIQYHAYEFFLTVDPIYHTMRSSGKLFAKIERGARAYEDFLDIVLYDLSPTIISLITVIVSFMLFDFRIGMITLILVILIGIINIAFNLFLGSAFEKNLIDADDEVKSQSVESLNQIQLIRATYATNQMTNNVKTSTIKRMYKEGSAWLASSTLNLATRFIYLSSILILGYYVISAISQGLIDEILGITLIITYIRGTYEVIKIGRKLRKLIKSTTRIEDLYNFIKNFGKQTFAVLKSNVNTSIIEEKKNQDKISLNIENLYFDYNPKAKIFENHKLYLEVNKSQKNKLYGIIGPSGMGKTTLLSILGGQLKPTNGQILLNDLDIYKLDDKDRAQLIALQGQVAGSLSGTLKNTLLVGLPQNRQIYSDSQIIDVLKEVGIWQIFEEKNGLATAIGESGFTLSGGQRQRLNFAALYLRAQFYKPILILIDEPTSSLDPVSEKAITNMINQLAESSLTFVIAHRLNTLESAVAIIDFSLISAEKNITLYTTKELKVRSFYYKKLVEGDLDIDN